MSLVLLTIDGTIYNQMPLTGANEPGSASQAFSAGVFAAVTVPAGSIGVYIIPPDVSSGTITMKGIAGDTGINIPQAVPSYHSLDPAGASFGLQCAGSITISFIFV